MDILLRLGDSRLPVVVNLEQFHELAFGLAQNLEKFRMLLALDIRRLHQLGCLLLQFLGGVGEVFVTVLQRLDL